MTRQQRMTTRIEQHGRQLLAIFPNATERDPVALCKKLRHLEREASAIGLRLCNGPEFASEDEPDRLCALVLHKVYKLLTGSMLAGHESSAVPIFINRDPRGHALKIRDEWMSEHKATLHKDWGGYGILAPDLTSD